MNIVVRMQVEETARQGGNEIHTQGAHKAEADQPFAAGSALKKILRNFQHCAETVPQIQSGRCFFHFFQTMEHRVLLPF